MPDGSECILVFGATGAIGRDICRSMEKRGLCVVRVSRRTQDNSAPINGWLIWPDLEKPINLSSLPKRSVTGVVWAQGMNASDSIRSIDLAAHRAMYSANVLGIISSLSTILDQGCLADKARLVILSSIWQNLGRANKMSYMVTKSALAGLVRSLSIDLGGEGIIVNAVLPGPLDTPMTRAALSETQIAGIAGATPVGVLPNVSDLCSLVEYLLSAGNSITGQFITVDGGFSHAKVL